MESIFVVIGLSTPSSLQHPVVVTTRWVSNMNPLRRGAIMCVITGSEMIYYRSRHLVKYELRSTASRNELCRVKQNALSSEVCLYLAQPCYSCAIDCSPCCFVNSFLNSCHDPADPLYPFVKWETVTGPRRKLSLLLFQWKKDGLPFFLMNFYLTLKN